MFDGILFDLDGTLWDAVPEIALSWSRGIRESGVDRPPTTAEELRPLMGKVLEDIGDTILPGLPPQRQMEIMKRCCQLEIEYLALHGAALYPREEETLQRLSGMCPLYVVSNCQDGYIQAFYQGTGMGKYFSDWECAGRTGRPKSENIALVAARNGLKNPVYVGDTALDCTSAREAGVPFVHARYGFGQVEGVPGVETFSQLPQVLGELSPG